MTPWWRDAVVYQVYPRSFADSDGDGNGDLPGIRSRLPYLRDLGVDAVWLSPFYLSPQADGGYDVTDYRAVDPMFGTLDDAAALIRDAHDLGLRVIVDVVPNHSSDRHAWFERALADGPGSEFRRRYHFADRPPNDWESVFGGPAWTRVADGQWYLHLFAPEQPDFNWAHPAVAEDFRETLRFWLDLGVDGFRVDVAHGLVKGAEPFDQDGVHEIYRSWRRLLDGYPGERIGVAEAWAATLDRVAAYVRPDELHQVFNFRYLAADWDAVALRAAIDDSLASTAAVGAPATWVLSNHDVPRHATRLMSDLTGEVAGRRAEPADPVEGLRRARAATLLMLALPGSAYLYQGEELGLPEVLDLPDEARRDPAFHRGDGQDGYRDGCRVPLPWSGEKPPYGFGPGASWLPQPPEWAGLSVAAQEGVPGSTLELYRRALALRRGLTGELTWLDSPPGVLAFRRGDLECVVNLSGSTVLVGGGGVLLASGEIDGTSLPADTTLPADTSLPADTTLPSQTRLPSDTTIWRSIR